MQSIQKKNLGILCTYLCINSYSGTTNKNNIKITLKTSFHLALLWKLQHNHHHQYGCIYYFIASKHNVENSKKKMVNEIIINLHKTSRY